VTDHKSLIEALGAYQARSAGLERWHHALELNKAAIENGPDGSYVAAEVVDGRLVSVPGPLDELHDQYRALGAAEEQAAHEGRLLRQALTRAQAAQIAATRDTLAALATALRSPQGPDMTDKDDAAFADALAACSLFPNLAAAVAELREVCTQARSAAAHARDMASQLNRALAAKREAEARVADALAMVEAQTRAAEAEAASNEPEPSEALREAFEPRREGETNLQWRLRTGGVK
jgi:hypothetical protein